MTFQFFQACILLPMLPIAWMELALSGERDRIGIAVAWDQPQPNTVVTQSLPSGSVRQVHHLEMSTDLVSWREIAFSNAAFDRYRLSSGRGDGFFQIRSQAWAADGASANDWTNQLGIFDQSIFTEPGADGLRNPTFAKFTVALAEPERVYFQDSDRYPFHFEFARARLPLYKNIPFQEYVRISLFTEGQELILGTVILPPDPSISEVAIQFTGNDVFAIEDVAAWFRMVRSRLVVPDGWRFLYIPTFEQSAAAFENLEWFAGQGLTVATASRWLTQNACYSPGWALGRIKYFAASEINAAYGDGRLSYRDILVTDQIPAEIPVVAGVIALTPATPNSHVAILSRSFGIPFAYPSGAALQEQVKALDGHEVLLVVEVTSGECVFRIQDVEGKLSEEQRKAILDSKSPPEAVIRPISHAGTYYLDPISLTPEDIDVVGGKSANFGFLRRTIPENIPDPAVALTFDLWMEFLDQPIAALGGATLGESIAADLEGFSFPPDVAVLRPVLEAIRKRIRADVDFTLDQQQSVLGALTLAGFDPNKRIRFRSSTNVEDSEYFSGAGLYDSFSGCMADDTDSDNAGPSRCDADESNERGVFRAIQKVYASFYNENAYIERLRHDVGDSQVGMALLVHPSSPDELELGNGVATLEVRRAADAARMVEMTLVSQTGANSITNPDNASLPEVVVGTYRETPQEADLVVEQRSALVAEGGNVLRWKDDYLELVGLLDRSARAYETYFPDDQILDLDFEWKKVTPDKLVIKQIRRIPRIPTVPPPVIP